MQNLKSEIADIGAKLDKLLSAYLDEIVSAEEYAAQKEKMLARKVECNEEIGEIESGSVSWLEPARAFVKSLNYATELRAEWGQVGNDNISKTNRLEPYFV